MRIFRFAFVAAILLAALGGCKQGSSPARVPTQTPAHQATTVDQANYVPVTHYDPKRDAQKDIRAAIAQAGRTHKRVLLEIGGEWCSWCHTLDSFFDSHPDLLAYREQHFITVKINYSDENKNEAVLSQYPEIPGFPHLFVLDQDGRFLHSEGTSQLENGRSYNLDKIFAFLRQWTLP